MGLTPAQIEETKAALERHGGNVSAVARELGLTRSTVQNRVARVRAASTENARTPVQQLRPGSIASVEKPRIRVPYRTYHPAIQEDDRIYKVLAIGDHHDKPGRDKTRALWIGRHAAETRPDAIVSIGDWASLDSLSTHEKPGSENDATRPPFHEELDSLDESLSLLHRDLPIGEIPVFHTNGNHEHRAVRAANLQPKLCGDLPLRLEEVFSRYRWQTRPFGETLDLFGVDFVHCFLNKMGREVGGDNLSLIANKCSRSVVFGHTHVNGVFNQTKYGHDFGKSRKVTVVNLGTSMPYGIVEKYSGLSCTGWGYGIYDLRIRGGEILTAKPMDMLELQERYE